MQEVWRQIKGCEGAYEISSFGRVKSLKSGKPLIMKPKVESNGYLRISLYNNKKGRSVLVHKLVAEAFLGQRPDGMQVNHIDGDKTNNKVDNLEYCTCSENIKHAYNTGLKEKCREHGSSMFRMNEGKLKAYRNRISRAVVSICEATGEEREHESVNAAARETLSDVANVSRVLKGDYRQTNGYRFKYKEEVKND